MLCVLSIDIYIYIYIFFFCFFVVVFLFFQSNIFQNCIFGLFCFFLKVQISNISINFIFILNHYYCYTFCCYFPFYDTAHRGLKTMLTLASFPSDLFQRHLNVILKPDGGVSSRRSFL